MNILGSLAKSESKSLAKLAARGVVAGAMSAATNVKATAQSVMNEAQSGAEKASGERSEHQLEVARLESIQRRKEQSAIAAHSEARIAKANWLTAKKSKSAQGRKNKIAEAENAYNIAVSLAKEADVAADRATKKAIKARQQTKQDPKVAGAKAAAGAAGEIAREAAIKTAEKAKSAKALAGPMLAKTAQTAKSFAAIDSDEDGGLSQVIKKGKNVARTAETKAFTAVNRIAQTVHNVKDSKGAHHSMASERAPDKAKTGDHSALENIDLSEED